jgi:hypothetical protein
MNRNVLLAAGLVVAATLTSLVALATTSSSTTDAAAGGAAPAPVAVDPADLLVRPDGHRLSTAPDGQQLAVVAGVALSSAGAPLLVGQRRDPSATSHDGLIAQAPRGGDSP